MNRENYDRIVRALEEGVGEGLIKVRVPIQVDEQPNLSMENMWARPIGTKYAKIQNIPFFAMNIGLGDIVQIDPGSAGLYKAYVRTISRGSYTVGVIYGRGGETTEALRAKMQAIVKHVKPLGIDLEGMMPGVLSMAIPTMMSVQEACEVLAGTPHILTHSLVGVEQSEYDINFRDWEDDWDNDVIP